MLSLITQIHDRNFLLEQTLPTWLNYPCGEILIVDQPGKERAYDVVSKYFSDPRIKLIEILNYDQYSNPKGRNVAFRNASYPDILYLDSDVKILPEMPVINLEENYYYRHVLAENIPLGGCVSKLRRIEDNLETYNADGFTVWRGCEGCILINKLNFLKVNGFNERLHGYGMEDSDFCDRLNALKLIRKNFPPYLSHIDHSDSLRAQAYDEKDIGKSNENNQHIMATQPWTNQDKQKTFDLMVYQKFIKKRVSP